MTQPVITVQKKKEVFLGVIWNAHVHSVGKMSYFVILVIAQLNAQILVLH